MLNAKIKYELRMNRGPKQGQIVHVDTDIVELEDMGLPGIVLDRGLLECWCNQGEYQIREREIVLTSS